MGVVVLVLLKRRLRRMNFELKSWVCPVWFQYMRYMACRRSMNDDQIICIVVQCRLY